MQSLAKAKSDSKVVKMPKQVQIVYKRPAPPSPVTQEDLATIIALQLARDAAQKALDDKIKSVHRALEQGAIVERGMHTAYLRPHLIVT